MSLSPGEGIEIDFVVGRDAMVLDLPFAFEAVDGGAGRGDAATIDQLGISADTDKTAPGAFADEWADAGFAEIPGQRIAAGAGHFVDDHDLGAVDGFGRAGPIVAFASDDLAHHGPAEVFDDVVGELSTFVEALVDDGALFPNLRKEVAIEAGVTGASGVGDVDIGDAASGSLIDTATIIFDPGEVAKIFFTLNRNDSNVA